MGVHVRVSGAGGDLTTVSSFHMVDYEISWGGLSLFGLSVHNRKSKGSALQLMKMIRSPPFKSSKNNKNYMGGLSYSQSSGFVDKGS